MQMILCPNCGKQSGFKRALGFGTFFMVLITFGLWLLMIPFYPVRCINCGLTRTSATWQNASRGGKILIACIWICVAVLVLHSMRQTTPRSEQPAQPERQPAQPAQPVVAVSAHEARLAELRRKRESLGVSTAIDIELGRNLARDAMKLSMEPFPDPDERQFLIDKMEEQRRRAAESLEQLNRVNAEIAKEEGQQQPSSEPTASEPPSQAATKPPDTSQPVVPPSTTESSPSAPPAEASKPTSGVLCNGPVEVQQNWEFTFRNLPGGQLKFTFDHDAWLPLIHREPDGTQTVIMRSIKPGIQTKCDIRWEIAQ
jgi:hypothetical protein